MLCTHTNKCTHTGEREQKNSYWQEDSKKRSAFWTWRKRKMAGHRGQCANEHVEM